MKKLTSRIDSAIIALKTKAARKVANLQAKTVEGSNDHLVTTIALIIVAVVLVALIFAWAKTQWNTTSGQVTNEINGLFNNSITP